jgi:hypothetical protein
MRSRTLSRGRGSRNPASSVRAMSWPKEASQRAGPVNAITEARGLSWSGVATCDSVGMKSMEEPRSMDRSVSSSITCAASPNSFADTRQAVCISLAFRAVPLLLLCYSDLSTSATSRSHWAIRHRRHPRPAQPLSSSAHFACLAAVANGRSAQLEPPVSAARVDSQPAR